MFKRRVFPSGTARCAKKWRITIWTKTTRFVRSATYRYCITTREAISIEVTYEFFKIL